MKNLRLHEEKLLMQMNHEYYSGKEPSVWFKHDTPGGMIINQVEPKEERKKPISRGDAVIK